MGMMINRRRVMGGGGKLPYDYEVEYLESSGHSVIKLPFVFNSANLVIQTKVIIRRENKGGYSDLYRHLNKPWNDNRLTRLLQVDGSILYCQMYGGLIAHCNNIQWDNILNLKIGNFYLKNIDNNTYYFSNSQVTTANIGNAQYATLDIEKLRIYYVTYIQDNITICDFIPVIKDNVGYMYDKVSGQLFGNAGTGSFILGPGK